MKQNNNNWKTIIASIGISIVMIVAIIQLRNGFSSISEFLSLLFLLLVIAMFFGAFFLSRVIADTIGKWINQPDIKGKKRAKAPGDNTVHYSVKHMGEEPVFLLEANQQGRFIVDGDYITVGNIAFSKKDIQWLGLRKKSNFVRMDVKVNEEWFRINIYLDDDTLDEFLKRVPDKLKQSRYTRRPEVRTYTGKKAHITTQNLQGMFEKHEEVELHVTPLWMVVLHNGRVIQQHFIDDIADIRCTKHPTDLDDDMQLLTFEVGEEAFTYALKDKTFATRLSDAAKEGIDSEMMRKKKKQS